MPLELKVYFIALLVIFAGVVVAWWIMGRVEEADARERKQRRRAGESRSARASN